MMILFQELFTYPFGFQTSSGSEGWSAPVESQARTTTSCVPAVKYTSACQNCQVHSLVGSSSCVDVQVAPESIDTSTRGYVNSGGTHPGNPSGTHLTVLGSCALE